ncbi:MAG: hypothetical protein ACLPHP_08735 [Candidatus Sulfotelmatobacter sp.]
MKRAVIAGLGLYVGWLEFSDDLAYWLPAWGQTIESGYGWGQVVILGLLGAIIFGTVAAFSYRFLNWIFE